MKKIILISLCFIVFILCGTVGVWKLKSDKTANNNDTYLNDKTESREVISKEQAEEFRRILINNVWQIKEIVTVSGKEVNLFEAFGSGIHLSMGSLNFFDDGTFENIPSGVYGDIDIDGNYYIAEDGKVTLEYNEEYKEVGELSYGGESPTILVFDTNLNSSAEIYTNGEKCNYIFQTVETGM